MKALCIALVIIAFATVQILIGGARLLYSLPAYALLAVAAVLPLLPRWRADPNVRTVCLATTALCFAWLLVRNVLSPVDYLARPDFFNILGCLTVYFLVAVQLTKPAHRLAIFAGLLFLSIAHLAVAAAQFKRGDAVMVLPWIWRLDSTWRASGFYISPNHLAGLLEVVAVMGLSVAVWSGWKLWVRVLVGYVVAGCVMGVAITGSRGGYVSTAFGLAAFAVICLAAWSKVNPERFRSRLIGMIAAVALVVGSIFLMAQSAGIKERLSTIYEPKNMRVFMWKAAIEQFKLSPVWGAGSGTYVYYGRQFRDPSVQNDPIFVHNDYLHLLAEYGVAGAAVFLIFLLSHLVSGVRGFSVFVTALAKRTAVPSDALALNIGALCALATYVAHSVVDFNLHIPANALVMAFVFGILANPGVESPASAPGWVSQASRYVPPVLGLLLLTLAVPKLPGELFAEKARVALRLAQPDEARAFAQHGLEYERKNPDLFYYLGEADRLKAYETTDSDERLQLNAAAATNFQQALALYPQDVRTMLKLSQTYDKLDRFEDAEAVLKTAMRADPNLGSVYAFYGIHFQSRNLLPEAADWYRKVLALDSQNPVALAGLKEIEQLQKPVRTRGGIQMEDDF
jgi:O-antigen ligase